MTSSYSQIIKLIKIKRGINKIPGKIIVDELHLKENNFHKKKRIPQNIPRTYSLLNCVSLKFVEVILSTKTFELLLKLLLLEKIQTGSNNFGNKYLL